MVINFKNDGDIAIELPLNHVYNELYIKRVESEKCFRRIVAYLIRGGYIRGNIVDCGAWIGDNSIIWAKMISGVVYAIDPGLENCRYIELLKLYNGINNVEVKCKALSDKKVILSTNDNLHHSKFMYGTGGINRIFAISLDELYYRNEVMDIDFLHFDVEGMENLVIEGSVGIINKYSPIISYEQHINSDNYVLLSRLVTDMGYDVYMINEVLSDSLPDCRNFLALPIKYRGIEHSICDVIGDEFILKKIV